MDWMDILWHVVGSLGIVAVGGLLFTTILRAWALWAAAGINALVWYGREAIQALHKYGQFLAPWEWSLQKSLEAGVPAIVGLLAAWAVYEIADGWGR